MIPSRETAQEIRVITSPTNTYRLQVNENRITKHVDGLKAMEQCIYKILNTERYKYVIYNWNYGIELDDLYGKPIPYVKAELPRRITEALLVDDRITDVYDFVFNPTNSKNTLSVSFTAKTIHGDINSSKEVKV